MQGHGKVDFIIIVGEGQLQEHTQWFVGFVSYFQAQRNLKENARHRHCVNNRYLSWSASIWKV